MTDYWINPSLGANGTGTYVNPYNSFAEVNALTGDLGGATIAIKAGTSIRSRLSLANASNFVIDLYGDGAKPIIDGSDIYTGTWTYDATYDAWYIPYVEAGAYVANGVDLVEITYNNTRKYKIGEYVFYPTTNLTYVCIAQTFGGQNPGNATYWTATTAVASGHMWFKTSTSRIYITLGGVNPNTVQIERNASSRSSCILLTACSSGIVRNIQAQRGWSSNVIGIACGNDLEFWDNISNYAGGWNSQGRDGFSIYGDYTGTKSSGILLIGNTGDYNQNNLIEIDATDGCIIESNTGNYNGQLIELWGHNINTEVRYNYALNCIPRGSSDARGNCIWITGPTAPSGNRGGNTGSVVESNILMTGYYGGVEVSGGTGHKVRHNTIGMLPPYYDSGSGVTLSATGAEADVSCNIFFLPLQGQQSITTVTGTTYTGDYNCVWRGLTDGTTNSFNGNFQGTSTSTLAVWRTASGQDANSFVANPLFTDSANGDYTLQAGSPCKLTGGATWVAGEARKRAFNGEMFPFVTPDVGAIQSVDTFSPSVLTQAPGGGY